MTVAPTRRSTVTAPEQLSAVVAVPSVASRLLTVTLHDVAPAPVWSVTGAGAVTEGFSLSTTVTVCVAVAMLPAASVTFHVTVVVPRGNEAGASFVTASGGNGQLSPVVGVPRLTFVATQEPASVPTSVRFAGGVIVGTVLSTTVTVCMNVAMLPLASVAL